MNPAAIDPKMPLTKAEWGVLGTMSEPDLAMQFDASALSDILAGPVDEQFDPVAFGHFVAGIARSSHATLNEALNNTKLSWLQTVRSANRADWVRTRLHCWLFQHGGLANEAIRHAIEKGTGTLVFWSAYTSFLKRWAFDCINWNLRTLRALTLSADPPAEAALRQAWQRHLCGPTRAPDEKELYRETWAPDLLSDDLMFDEAAGVPEAIVLAAILDAVPSEQRHARYQVIHDLIATAAGVSLPMVAALLRQSTAFREWLTTQADAKDLQLSAEAEQLLGVVARPLALMRPALLAPERVAELKAALAKLPWQGPTAALSLDEDNLQDIPWFLLPLETLDLVNLRLGDMNCLRRRYPDVSEAEMIRRYQPIEVLSAARNEVCGLIFWDGSSSKPEVIAALSGLIGLMPDIELHLLRDIKASLAPFQGLTRNEIDARMFASIMACLPASVYASACRAVCDAFVNNEDCLQMPAHLYRYSKRFQAWVDEQSAVNCIELDAQLIDVLGSREYARAMVYLYPQLQGPLAGQKLRDFLECVEELGIYDAANLESRFGRHRYGPLLSVIPLDRIKMNVVRDEDIDRLLYLHPDTNEQELRARYAREIRRTKVRDRASSMSF